MERIAVIGLGNISVRHRRNLKALYPHSILYAMSASGRIPEEPVEYCDRVVEDVQTLIDADIGFAVIASPATSHASHAVPLIQAGIPVLIEKPVAADATDAQEILEAVSQYQTPVGVGYCLRYLPSAQHIRQLLFSGKIGRLYHVFIETGQYLPDWRPAKDYRKSVSAQAHLGGGALLELSHELDYCQWLLGDIEVQHSILKSSEELGLDVEDSADLMALSGQGAVVHLHLDFLQRKVRRQCRFVGSQGVLEWDLICNEIRWLSPESTETLYSEPDWDKNQMYIHMLEDFVRLSSGQQSGAEPLATIEEAAKTVRLIEQIKHNG